MSNAGFMGTSLVCVSDGLDKVDSENFLVTKSDWELGKLNRLSCLSGLSVHFVIWRRSNLETIQSWITTLEGSARNDTLYLHCISALIRPELCLSHNFVIYTKNVICMFLAIEQSVIK
jgi:hypothetical protein